MDFDGFRKLVISTYGDFDRVTLATKFALDQLFRRERFRIYPEKVWYEKLQQFRAQA